MWDNKLSSSLSQPELTFSVTCSQSQHNWKSTNVHFCCRQMFSQPPRWWRITSLLEDTLEWNPTINFYTWFQYLVKQHKRDFFSHSPNLPWSNSSLAQFPILGSWRQASVPSGQFSCSSETHSLQTMKPILVARLVCSTTLFAFFFQRNVLLQLSHFNCFKTPLMHKITTLCTAK